MKKTAQTSREKVSAKQHILVAVTGNTPQIVTETLYVMAIARKPLVRWSLADPLIASGVTPGGDSQLVPNASARRTILRWT